MAGGIVRGDRGAGEDEVSLAPARIHFAPDMVPDDRSGLPFVDQPWSLPREQHCGGHGDQVLCGRVHIEQNLARGEAAGGRGLAAGPGAFNQDRSGRIEALGELPLGHPLQVVRGPGGGWVPGMRFAIDSSVASHLRIRIQGANF